jgi:Dolichyl-phosphate-mannose-protein mannosyltransferase
LLKTNFKAYIVIIPLVLAAVTHLWNVAGFPTLHPDESDYLRKSVHYLKGFGPQETSNDPIAYPDYPYTHPYFGQLFLAGLLGVTGYPNSLNPTADVQSIEMLHLVPRAIMGILAVLDTFLLYKITERRYNKNVALIASVLFAVMPMTWILRRIYLDTLLMPLLLSSILFAIYIRGPNNSNVKQRPTININKNVLVLLSGIFLGLAIYTKVPAFTMIPLVGYLVVTNSKSNRKKTLALWLIPVILIPLLWPAYAFSIGEFKIWMNSITFQQGRASSGTGENLFNAFKDLSKIDPVTIVLGIISIAFVGLRKDIWLILWVVPMLLFSFYLGWVQYFHLIPIFPAFCIAIAVTADYVMSRVKRQITRNMVIVLVSILCLFGLVNMVTLMTLDTNSIHFRAYASVIQEISQRNNLENSENSEVTLIGHRMYYWIPRYVFDLNYYLLPNKIPLEYIPQNIVLVANDGTCCCRCDYFHAIYVATSPKYEFTSDIMQYNDSRYPFSSLQLETNLGKKVEVRTR